MIVMMYIYLGLASLRMYLSSGLLWLLRPLSTVFHTLFASEPLEGEVGQRIRPNQHSASLRLTNHGRDSKLCMTQFLEARDHKPSPYRHPYNTPTMRGSDDRIRSRR
jgi:hypothetical protein